MELQKDQLFMILENHIKELINKLPPGELEGLLMAVRMVSEELGRVQEKTDVILLKAEVEHLRDKTNRQNILLELYRKNVRIN